MSWQSGQLDYTDLSPNAGLLGTQIADGTIQLRNIAPQTVLNTHIVNQTITNTQVAQNTITGGTTGNLALNTLTADNISAGTITASQIAANTITGTNILTMDLTGKSATFDTGTIGGFTMGADYLRDTGNSFGLASTVTGGDDVRFWAGSTFANRATAPFNVTEAGVITATSGIVGGWNLSSTALVGPAGAIFRSGQSDFNVGTGFWLGNVSGTPKFSIGTQGGNSMRWDGTNLIVTGAFTASTVMQTFSYTVANLPVPPTIIGYNSPGGNS